MPHRRQEPRERASPGGRGESEGTKKIDNETEKKRRNKKKKGRKQNQGNSKAKVKLLLRRTKRNAACPWLCDVAWGAYSDRRGRLFVCLRRRERERERVCVCVALRLCALMSKYPAASSNIVAQVTPLCTHPCLHLSPPRSTPHPSLQKIRTGSKPFLVLRLTFIFLIRAPFLPMR